MYRKVDKNVVDKHNKCTEECLVNESIAFDDYKTCLFKIETL